MAPGANVLTFMRALPAYARHTVRFHLPAELLMGGFAGIVYLADIVARSKLGASDIVLAIQTSVPMMALVFAMVWRELLENTDRRKILILTGIFGKGLFLTVGFVTGPVAFAAVIIAVAVVDSAFLPFRNAIFHANYDRKVRGRLFGGVVSLMNLVLVGTSLLAAAWLDHWEMAYRVLFPIAAVLGLGSHLFYARIRVRGVENGVPAPEEMESTWRLVTRPFRRTVRILRRDGAFRRYETGFFVYGIAFLMNLPLVVMLIVDELKLSYADASSGKIVIGQVMMILVSPFAGMLLDRSHPARIMCWGSGLLAIHAFLLAGTFDYWTLFASYAMFGLAMTAVNLAWNLGPVHFAPTDRDAESYMAVHVTLVGVRAIIGPALALYTKWQFGLRTGFVVSGALYVVATVMMFRLSQRVDSSRES